MSLSRSILDSRAIIGVALACMLGGCGQKGPLFLPTTPAAAQRATLPETLKPAGTTTPPEIVTPAASPSR